MTFYEVLEIDPRASTAEIERAFRRLARKVHPDLNSGDPRGAEARMKQLNEIRDTLTDPLRRAAYDAALMDEAGARAGVSGTRRATYETGAPVVPVAADESTATRRAAPSWAKRVWLAVVVGTISTAVFVALYPMEYDKAITTAPAPSPSAAPSSDARDARTGVEAATTPAVAVQAPAPPARAASPSAAPAAPARRRPRGRAVVHIGSSADDVIRKLGAPDRVEPGARTGDAVFHYGHLRLEIKNGRVARGDAAE